MSLLLRSLACLVLALPMAAPADCPGPGEGREALVALKAAGFTVDDAAARQALALSLVDCLGDPDPALRDGIAYEALAGWLRADLLDQDTRRSLLAALLPLLAAGPGDEDGFRAPFAALVLSEVARTDRLVPWLNPVERNGLLDAAVAYLEGVRDYRGFVPGEGWRHGVAHGADVLMQLALNPALDKPQLDRILAAVARQVAPPGHAYVHGESERLTRPALFVLRRGLHDDADVAAWLATLSNPAPMTDWMQAFASPEGLNRRHNTRYFLMTMYTVMRESGDEALVAKVPAVVVALQAVK